MSTVPSFEADLRAAREARGLSLDEIQQETRIPVDVLARFERGELLGDPTFNDVYLRAFLKAYAKAVGLSPAVVLDGYAALRGGTYQGLQEPADVEVAQQSSDAKPLPSTPPRAPRTAAASSASAPSASAPSASAPSASAPPASAPPASAPPASVPPPAVAALSGAAPAPAPPPAPPAAPPRARVERPPVPGATRSFDKNWGTITGLTAAVVLVIGVLLYFLVFREAGPAERTPPGQTTQTEPQDEAPVDAPRFTLPIAVTVAASGDGLQWFRTETDGGTRTPHWIDAATEQTFRADSSLVLYGEGTQGGATGGWADATLTLQGLSWRPAEGTTVRIDARRGQALLDSLARVQGRALPPAAVADAPPEPPAP